MTKWQLHTAEMSTSTLQIMLFNILDEIGIHVIK